MSDCLMGKLNMQDGAKYAVACSGENIWCFGLALCLVLNLGVDMNVCDLPGISIILIIDY